MIPPRTRAGTPSKQPRPRLRIRSRWYLLFLLFLALVGGAYQLVAVGGGVSHLLVSALDRVRGLGAWGAPLLVCGEALAFTLLLPITPIHVGIGFLYGPLPGLLLAWCAYGCGCTPPFLLARMPAVAQRIMRMRHSSSMPGAGLLDGVAGAVEDEPFKLIVCLRLSPVLPSPLNSYARLSLPCLW